LAVASSGIAALLIPGGRTAHSLFKIPLKLYSDSSCQLNTNSPVAKLILEAVAIVWDEAGMHPSYGFEAVDRLCRDITKIDRPFGGKTIICGGDFRQVLPVIPKASKSSTLDQTLKRSRLWTLFRKFKLVQNMRVDRNALEFSEFLMYIGNGVGTEISNLIDIPGHLFTPENSLDSLISFVYDDFESNYLSTDYLSNRAILTPTNLNVDQINSKVLDMFPGATKVYLSADSVEAAESVNSNLYPVELLNSLAPNGIPSHELRLKVGVPIIILRNLDPKNGLCNGTRAIVKQMLPNILEVELMNGNKKGERAFIPRISLSPSDTTLPFTLIRRQFPIRLAFSMTINKAQGQTVPRLGLFLPSPVFAHGQLYVGLSRATSMINVKIVTENDHKNKLKNIVYKEILL
jgi:ATP-dependent DNA helicase PIF1